MTRSIELQSEFIYLDHNATTPVDHRVVDAMLPLLSGLVGNPSSSHRFGEIAREAVSTARSQVMTLIGAERADEIVFTSGGSESNNAAILSALSNSAGRNEIVVSAIEHASILKLCAHLERTGQAKVHRIGVDEHGCVDVAHFASMICDKTAVASVQWVNNETGVVQPVQKLAEIAHEHGALFHCDAVQAAGRISLDLKGSKIDMLSVSAHKIHGPKGVGALYLRRGTAFTPLVFGGRQERNRRAGTENVAGIAGFGVAAAIAHESMREVSLRLAQMRDELQDAILRFFPDALIVGGKAERVANTLCVAFNEIEGEDLVEMLDRRGIAVSSGSACGSGMMEPSHVMKAMRLPFSHLRGAVRISLSRDSKREELQQLLLLLPKLVGELTGVGDAVEVMHG